MSEHPMPDLEAINRRFHSPRWSMDFTVTASEADFLISEAREAGRLRELIGTPQLHDFSHSVELEAAHQRERWGTTHDAGKEPEDWFWLVGYLTGKALAATKAGNTDKALHHTISTAAALANWHAALSGADNSMRPGHGEEMGRLRESERGEAERLRLAAIEAIALLDLALMGTTFARPRTGQIIVSRPRAEAVLDQLRQALSPPTPDGGE